MIQILDFFGVAVFAVTGALVAGRKRMDVFGVVVVALVTALGGGTVRDLILGKPVFWVAETNYLIVGTAAGLITFFTAPLVKPPVIVLLVADALGLAVFTVIGAQRALAANCPHAVALVMGVMTGVMGGMLRDVLCAEIPLILRREIYATASLAGGIVFLILSHYRPDRGMNVIIAIATVLVVRLAAIGWNLSLPVFGESKEKTGQDDGGDART